MRHARASLLLIAFVLAAATGAAAQQVVTTGRVNLRRAPSGAAAVVRTIDPGTVVDALDGGAHQGGWVHVRSGTDEGWVSARWVRAVESTEPTPDAVAPTTGAVPPASPATPTAVPAPSPATPSVSPPSPAASAAGIGAVDPAWAAPEPVAAEITNSAGAQCAADGSGSGGAAPSDPLTNTRKNRTDVPAEVHPVPFQAVAQLPYPHNAKKSLAAFSPADLAAVMRFEGRAVSVEGYLADIKSEGPEQTNCGAPATHRADVDWHTYLVEHPGDPNKLSVIAEMTPRTRPAHQWTFAGLRALAGSSTRVRLTGWLLLDPEHYNNVNGYVNAQRVPATNVWRATIWELHPVTRIEVCQVGRWVDLDGGPAGGACGP